MGGVGKSRGSSLHARPSVIAAAESKIDDAGRASQGRWKWTSLSGSTLTCNKQPDTLAFPPPSTCIQEPDFGGGPVCLHFGPQAGSWIKQSESDPVSLN